jgi:NAD(P)-dependent dehydrogenase (short-subunit alcohol dehydrogenase family)
MFTHADFSFHSVIAVLLIAVNSAAIALRIRSAPAINSPDNTATTRDMRGNIVIVTGSNTGIGKATALKLAKRGATVVLACRNVKQGMKAMMEITTELERSSSESNPFAINGKALFMRMDLSSLKSVADFVARFKEQFQRLDILVNNAGLNTSGTTVNGLEQLFQVNYLGHYYLTSLLTDVMQFTGQAVVDSSSINGNSGSSSSGRAVPSVARVVNLSSTMHHLGQADFKACAFGKYSPAMVLKGYSYYSDSKLYMNLMTAEINRRFDTERGPYYGDSKPEKLDGQRPIVSLCANPGAVKSDIWRNSILNSLSFVMNWLFLTVDEGSATSDYAATMDLQVLRDYQQRYASEFGSAKLGDNFVFCSDVPCLIPYAMSPAAPRLHDEVMAAFAGPRFGAVSFPVAVDAVQHASTPAELARELWDYSATLCAQQIDVHIVSE